ncbi:DUF2913 family protein [Shewanella psychropiezotolerans]|uniref:DUF2913 family protein n=1 Tax=Shewanella psychropiezotolerans TaxID=2593655 RepID=A0ABX5WUL8_9GAMM|nr:MULTISPECIES: DUF2913 family protein [Shewanella]MPY23165.1 DUF2913 family protein [Shewanella sp. YLB-07]QDO82800.1 DUF2913 family protein [Shewanella psychropiezotolerans]
MTNYNQALIEITQAGLAALEERSKSKNVVKTAAAESHFLCNWMVQALKERRFSKLIAKELNQWIRDARSMGAAAQLTSVLQRIEGQYLAAEQNQAVGASLNAMLSELKENDWVVILDSEVTTKLKLDSSGQNSLIISNKQYDGHIDGDQLTKTITLYVRANEQELAKMAAKHGLLLSQGNKKASLIKHHKAYLICPDNQLPAMALLVE